MGRFLSGVLLPLLLLTAAVVNWSLISLADLIASLIILYTAPKIGTRCRRRYLVSCYVITFSTLAILSHAIFHIILVVKGDHWSIADAQWAKLMGFIRDQSWRSPSVIYFLVIQLSAALTAFTEVYGCKLFLCSSSESCLRGVVSSFEQIGSHLRVVCCLLLPPVQLIAGISHPSWVSLPFFICSCIGLVDWSLTSNFLALFRWWRCLLFYAGLNIVLLYIYQLPIEFSTMFQWVANFIGLYKISVESDLLEICSGLSLLLFYFILSCIRCDLMEMNIIVSARESSLTEHLLPSKHSFFIRQSRSGVRHTNVLLRGAVFRTFSINFFTYGFPVSLFALSFWSFQFASLCAFGLLAYVGYLLYVFPSVFHLHHLNGLLLGFILLWAISTYVFNVAFTVFNQKLLKDMAIWETIGIWHYPVPGFYLLAQFGLGILVAMGNLVSNSVFLYLSDGDWRSSNGNYVVEEEETEVLIVATIAWGLRKSSRAIALVLILLLALKPGFVHSIYMIFFMVYLLSRTVSRRLRQCLILLCEIHFAVLYLLQLNLVSKFLGQKGSLAMEILSQLGLLDHSHPGDFLKIAGLACFCAIQNNGFDMLFSFSAIVQHLPLPPIGWNILKAGLNKSVLLSVRISASRERPYSDSSNGGRIALYLSTIEQKFLAVYRSCGTYIVCLTILLTIYSVTPNYASFGYLFFLLLWMNGRQLVGKARRRLWFPLKVYAVAVLIVTYCLSAFLCFRTWLSTMTELHPAFGYNPGASVLTNVWPSLAVVIVIELYSYERRLSKYFKYEDVAGAEEHTTFSLIKRLLIWHCEKILFLSLLYASLSPISAFGCVYLLGLVVCSTLPKSSRIPSKLYLVYSGFLLMVHYLFQMWGELAEMFPGQTHFHLSCFLGLQSFSPGFFGLESGMRAEVLVIAACVLQYNVFRWLENVPADEGYKGKWEEPCSLFNSPKEKSVGTPFSTKECESPKDTNPLLEKQKTWNVEGYKTRNRSYKHMHRSSVDNHKWNRKWLFLLRKERLEMQKTTLKFLLKYWTENMFNLFGLEINMIALLVASFAVLNGISLLYIASLAACVLLPRNIIRKLWPIFVFFSASILTLEYLAIWLNVTSWKEMPSSEAKVVCHDCWRESNLFFEYCRRCWLGIAVDDQRMLLSYYMVFMLACFKLRADRLYSFSEFHTYQQKTKTSVLSDLSFETKSMWTFLDYLRLYCYCHLLDLVLGLILITGTLEYDILHLGYLGFALIFFRLRLEILKKKNRIFKFLRIYNFALIVLSLAYQSPFVGDFSDGKCETSDYIYEVIGFYKYDYGFRITSRSSFVEIIIFMLVSLQSYMFSSQEFDYVSKYLEVEQVDALVREQEKRAAWKTAQLQNIRKAEDQKQLRNLQVEKMKSEMLNLQIQLHSLNTDANFVYKSPGSENFQRRGSSPLDFYKENSTPDKDDNDLMNTDHTMSTDSIPFEFNASPRSVKVRNVSGVGFMGHGMGSFEEITELKENHFNTKLWDSSSENKGSFQGKDTPLNSAVHLIRDGASHVKTLGKLAVSSLVIFFNIKHEEPDAYDYSSENEVYYELESQNFGYETLDQPVSVQTESERNLPDPMCVQIGILLRYMLAQMRSNNDVVCYCCFILIFLWNFSLLSMVYLAALFLYALCVNTGPSHMFWVIVLIYSEFCILLQYLYQIIIQHCGFSIQLSWLQELGFPEHKITSSFVISHLPLFLVYIFTLLQTSISVRDGEWASVTEFSSLKRRVREEKESLESPSWLNPHKLLFPVKDVMKDMLRSLNMYWKSVTQGAETPPYFVQLSMEVNSWPDDGIQPERIESGVNKLLKIVHNFSCNDKNHDNFHMASSVRVQSIERSLENPNIGLVVFEVVYAFPSSGLLPMEGYKSLTPAADVANEILKGQRAGIFNEVRFPYPVVSVIGGGRREIDLYAYVFCADLAVFFLVAIFYQSVIKNNSEFLEVYQLEDQFPKEFVFILMIIFFLIVLDRIIYLCSFATGKVIFYLFSLVLFTYSVTKYAWFIESPHQHAGRFALRAIYLAKAISFAIQAVQIRYGIPRESTLYRQFLTSSVSQINFLGFRLYRALPFLYELRCVLDWSCTTTSLTMYDWLKLEDIHASLFLVKCDVDLNRVKHHLGQRQTKLTKFCNGICLFFILLCVIWAPMLMYSSGNPTNIANPIKDASVQIDLKTVSGRLTLFETTLCKKLSWAELDSRVDLDPKEYLSAYNEDDIQLICCQADASTLWVVPPIVQTKFIQSLQWSMNIVFSWQFTRDRPKGKELVKYELHIQEKDLPSPVEVMDVINGTVNSFRIYNVYPKYFRVTGSGDVRFLEQAVDMVSGDLVHNHGTREWWSFHDIDASFASGCGELAGPMAIIVSEETPQGILGETLSKFSIWGLYITFVLAVGRFIRLQCSDLRMRIPFENLPSCDRLLAICEDIYAARAEGELEVEEVLYWTLVKIYRSPHVLLDYTKLD